jgi:hypothetical protein
MSEGATGAKPRRGLRWTLGGLMLLIALVALPMAWYAQRAGQMARERAAAEARRADVVSQIKEFQKLFDEQAKLEKDQRSRAGARAGLSKEPSENSTAGGSPPAADAVEKPR